jgi:cobalt/nickel transport system permease protein
MNKKPFRSPGGRTKTGFIDKSIMAVIELLKGVVSNDEIAAKKGLLQGLDPRAKTLSVLLLVICALLAKNVLLLILLYEASILLAQLSSIRMSYFLKRTFFFVPLFSFFMVVPAIFSFVTPGRSLVSFTVFSIHFSITLQGVASAALFFFRVLASVSMVILLLLTTRQHALLKVLRIFKVPQVFVMTMGMSYRYIFLLLDTVQKTFIAMKSRVGFVASSATGRRIAGTTMASLWLRSYHLHSRVHDAMLSRGFSGEPAVMTEFRAGIRDALFLSVSLITLAGTVWMNRFFH